MTAMVRAAVVMAVYNGAARLEETLASITSQTLRDIEIVVVDDGSTDATGAILRNAARRDRRVVVITHTENRGLTHALIAGCATASAPVIARHDCGDVSRPARLARELALLESDPALAVAACEVDMIGPVGEPLFTTAHHQRDIRGSLLRDGLPAITSLPHHGAAMFRAAAYREAGGYRAQFRVAQDIDLWMRMAKLGGIAVVPEALYVARSDAGAISAKNRDEQLALTRIAIAIRDGGNEKALLAEAASIQPREGTNRDEAKRLYFIASCLRARGDARWRAYMREAWLRDRLHWRAALQLLTRWT
jgi:glycosyltransferase involved in cell wall biosynthesis